MKLCSKSRIFILIVVLQELLMPSFALLYIVRSNCVRGTVFTPVPSTVSNICLQCKCVMSNISYCKLLAVQLSVVCTAAITNPITAAPATTPVPTIPMATSTTATGINPRVSAAPAVQAVVNPAGATATVMMVTVPPMMVMMMTMGGAAVVPRASPAPAATG